MSFLAFLAATLGWGAVGVVAHELTHAGAALLLGRDLVGIDWRGLDVYWAHRGPASWRDTLISWAPILVGVLGAAGLLIAPVRPSVPAWIGWAVYTFNGIPGDLRVRAAAPARHN